MHLLDRLREMGFLNRRSDTRRSAEVDAAVNHSITSMATTRDLVDELKALELRLVALPNKGPKRTRHR